MLENLEPKQEEDGTHIFEIRFDPKTAGGGWRSTPGFPLQNLLGLLSQAQFFYNSLLAQQHLQQQMREAQTRIVPAQAGMPLPGKNGNLH